MDSDIDFKITRAPSSWHTSQNTQRLTRERDGVPTLVQLMVYHDDTAMWTVELVDGMVLEVPAEELIGRVPHLTWKPDDTDYQLAEVVLNCKLAGRQVAL